MPVEHPEVMQLIRLYQRCKTYHVLPFAGPLTDQPEWIMEMFDQVESTIEKARSKKMEEQNEEVSRESRARELNGRSR